MERFSEIIDKFETARLAEALGVAESHIRVMRARNSVPPRYFEPLVDLARTERVRGITLEKLHALYRARFAEAS